MDPNAFNAALNAPAGSAEQIQILSELRTVLEQQQSTVPIFLTTLAPRILAQTGESVIKQWMMDLLLFGLSQSSLVVENRAQIASSTLDAQIALLNEQATVYIKGGIHCLSASYPLLFRVFCANRSARQQWDAISAAKVRILAMVDDTSLPAGIRLSAIKFMQRAILVQTRGVNDPRVVQHQLQNKGDPNLSMCPTDHPFVSAQALETEGGELLKKCIMILYTSSNADILSALINTLAALFKLRPTLSGIVIQAVLKWTPQVAMTGQSPMSVRSVEKSIKILLHHIYKSPQGAPYARDIADAIQAQTARMEAAAQEARRKRALEAEAANEAAKRTKLEPTPVPTPPNIPTPVDLPTSTFANFDFSTLPLPLVIDILIANLAVLSDERLASAIAARRVFLSRGVGIPPTSDSIVVQQDGPPLVAPTPQLPVSASQLESQSQVEAQPTEPEPVIKEEPLDPLKMDIDDDDLEYEPDKLNATAQAQAEAEEDQTQVAPLDPSAFSLPAPKDLSDAARNGLVKSSVARIWDAGEEVLGRDVKGGSEVAVGLPPEEMWMLLIVRMISRGANGGRVKDEGGDDRALVHNLAFREDGMRQMLLDYLLGDFNGRIRLAIVWMNEEWYNDRIQAKHDPSRERQYDIWLGRLASSLKARLEPKDKTFAKFLMELPSVPSNVLSLCRELAETPQQMGIGFAALREFIQLRPPVRPEAMRILLDLTAHPEKVTRNAAINTVRRWVPDVEPMNTEITSFAKKLLGQLQEGQHPFEEHEFPRYLPPKLQLPARKAEVIQHVELMFALSVRVPAFLDEIFAAYVHMETTVQEAMQDLLAPLVRSLGPTNAKLLSLIKTFEPGAESLILRIIKILTENGRPNANLVALVKELISERNLDARFLMPIIGEMDKPDIVKNLPRIVSMLNGKPEPKALVKSAFQAIVAAPPESFTKGSSNQPRMKQSEQLTPVDLMVLLHEDKEIGIKPAMEAIGICFQIVDVFRSDVLAAVMQQLLDSATLPTLFLRTPHQVIQAVTTYKNLVGFVSTTLLSRLITKKIWTNPPLWEGFIRCAKVIAPASFGALLQLPREQLKELISKQPALKEDLREYVVRRAGPKARLLEVFSDQPDPPPSAAPPDSAPPTTQGDAA
ncbi:Symplekin tight junction protein C terminal [Rhizoctonia solani]|uniref:Symplekin tight junction protein C terminal n=1 Tax=Rhizoctonia solani TaxID=456999 RepID=A0A8H7LI36_9AGAM|nr:Symplekin tight junction protein C terminal [Rhizoctonia solani]